MTRRPWMDVTIKAALIGAAVLMYLDLKAEIRDVRVDLGDRIDRVENRLEARIDQVENRLGARIDGVENGLGVRIDRLEARIDKLEVRIDRVETKVDEVRGYLKFYVAAPDENPSPSDRKEQPASPGIH